MAKKSIRLFRAVRRVSDSRLKKRVPFAPNKKMCLLLTVGEVPQMFRVSGAAPIV
jgi:hypothetical protein